jgi:RNA polymerase sigma-70 factor (ECF subfamily)
MNDGVEAEVFDELSRRYRWELHVHCYRMLGSFEAAEDHVQEVLLRAWRGRESFEGRSSARTWLYRIATNACLDTLRRTTPPLQPYPDQVLDERPGPEAAVVERETISLAFLAAIQLLPARQRAALILRDVLAWSAREVAELLDASVPAVNSAVQRARVTLRERWPGGREEWAPAGEPGAEQRELLERYIAAHEQADPEALVGLLREDVVLSIEPGVGEWHGAAEVAPALREGMMSRGRWRMLPWAANRQPAVAGYVLAEGDTAYRPFVLGVLQAEGGRISVMKAFEAPELFVTFGLPVELGI